MASIIGILSIVITFVLSCLIFKFPDEVFRNLEPTLVVTIIVVAMLTITFINSSYTKNVVFETDYLTLMKNRELRNYEEFDEVKKEKLDFLEKIQTYNTNMDFWYWGLNKVDISKYTFESPTKLKNEE